MASTRRKLSSAEETYQSSACIKEGRPSINDPGPKPVPKTSPKKFQMYEFGKPAADVPHKTVLLVGESGTGKSTLINALFHFIIGVSWSDRFRFNLIKEIRGRRRTQEITAYTIHHKPGYRIPFSLTLIDTPGFGDELKELTEVMIAEQLKSFLSETDQTGISHIDSVGFVVQSSRQKLMALEENIYKMLEDVFGKDIKSKLNFLLPFADLKILAWDAIKESSFFDPSFKYFTFNNSALTKQKDEIDDEFEEQLGKLFWEQNDRRYETFLNSLTNQVQSLFCICRGFLKQYLATVSKLEAVIKEEERKQQNSSCPITMQKNWRLYIGTVSRGEARTLQAPNSDVSLEIPNGSRGTFVSRVHTDFTRFRDIVPDSECVVGPCVEFEHFGDRTEKDKTPKSLYKIKIPHCVSNEALWKHIKVRKGSIFNSENFIEVHRKDEQSNNSTYYEINDKFVTIFTKHFCHFTCSACNYSCIASALIFLFGNMRSDRSETHVNVKVFLCSNLFSTKDYETDLIHRQKQKGYKLIEDKSIRLDSKSTDPKKCLMTLSISAETSTPETPLPMWVPADRNSCYWNERHKHFTIDGTLSSVMNIERCHNCININPMDVMRVEMRAYQVAHEFRGKVHLLVYVPPAHPSILRRSFLSFSRTLRLHRRQQDRRQGNPTRTPVGETDFTFRVKKGLHTQSIETSSQMNTNRQFQSFEDQLETNNNTSEETLGEILLDNHIVKLAKELSSDDIITLRPKLSLKNTDNGDSMHKIVQSLQGWLKTQPNRRVAYTKLKEALIDSGLNLLVGEILEKK